MSTTTLTAGVLNITDNFYPMTKNPATATQGYVDVVLTVIILVCAIIILVDSARRWYRVLVKKQYSVNGKIVDGSVEGFVPPEYGMS